MNKKELWELEGFDTYESWLENEERCIKRGVDSTSGLVESLDGMFDDIECRRILGIGGK